MRQAVIFLLLASASLLTKKYEGKDELFFISCIVSSFWYCLLYPLKYYTHTYLLIKSSDKNTETYKEQVFLKNA